MRVFVISGSAATVASSGWLFDNTDSPVDNRLYITAPASLGVTFPVYIEGERRKEYWKSPKGYQGRTRR